MSEEDNMPDSSRVHPTAAANARALMYAAGGECRMLPAGGGSVFVAWGDDQRALFIEVDPDGLMRRSLPLGSDDWEPQPAMHMPEAVAMVQAWRETAPELQRRLEAAERQIHRLIHGEEIESDRICDHELAHENLRQACAIAGLDPDELGRKHAEWIRNGARAATESFDELPFETREDVERELGDVEVVLAARAVSDWMASRSKCWPTLRPRATRRRASILRRR
jgi:hypothetical protein